MSGVEGAVAAVTVTVNRKKTTVARLAKGAMSGAGVAVAKAAMSVSRIKTTAARLAEGAVNRAKEAEAAAGEILTRTQITRRRAAATDEIGKGVARTRAEVKVETATETRSVVARAATPLRTAPAPLRPPTRIQGPLTVVARGAPDVEPPGVEGTPPLAPSRR